MTELVNRPLSPVCATIRLQFHKGFTLDDATALVGYFASLGVSHIYASPLLTARPGSMHGYDVVDPTRINPELGGEPAFRRLVDTLREHQMGLILDIVSNHMAVGGDANPWWLDVLEWGPASPYAEFFDIDWQSHDPLMQDQLLIPFLGGDYGEVLANGGISLHYDERLGTFYAAHHEHRFPLFPPTCARVLSVSSQPQLRDLAQMHHHLRDSQNMRRHAHELRAELRELAAREEYRQELDQCLRAFSAETADGRERLHQLLEKQHYRLASWRTASDDINWRRFFDINELGGLRVENARVFEATHQKIFSLIRDGQVDGLRIDHVDGLAEPRAYCRKLRRRVDCLQQERIGEGGASDFPIFVEKILLQDEELSRDWLVTGTTGYEFMNQISLLQHAPEGEETLTRLWVENSDRPADFASEVYEARKLLLQSSLAGDLETVSQGLLQVARQHRDTRDLTLGSIRRALTELVAHFPVYRTYAGAAGRSGDDERVFRSAVKDASGTLSEADWPALNRIDQWLGGEALCQLPQGPDRTLRRRILARFQQLTSPAAAKAVEDTACYRAGVLLSRYDVGFNPSQFSTSIAAFHQQCLQRSRHFPDNLLTTATHDNKRGEDTRARLAVISERPVWYADKVEQWRQMATPLHRQLADGPAPSPGDELVLYQTLLGSWPLDLDLADVQACHDYLQRLLGWQQKALREAKLRSSWQAVNPAYESACADFLTALLTAPDTVELRQSLAQAAMSLALPGALNSLGQTLLRMTTPGIPDLYQGAEFWDFNLVDPDNRRPVDYSTRVEALAASASASPVQLMEHWHNARLKQWLIRQTLNARKSQPHLFSRGRYQALQVSGAAGTNVLAFARYLDGEFVIVVTPIRSASLLEHCVQPHVPAERWQDTVIELPSPLQADRLFSALDGAEIPVSTRQLHLSHVLRNVPVNLLFSKPIRQEP